MTRRAQHFTVFLVALLTLGLCIPVTGQVTKGSISGTVADPQGAVVSGAQVKATNVDTGAVSTTTSDGSGLFRFSLLPVGTYNVEISQQGFKTTTQKNVKVVAGEDAGTGSVRLTVGEASDILEVTAAAPLIESTQAQVTNTFAGTELQNFAGVQENEGLDRLALFVPGVVASRSDNFSNTNGVGFSSNGLRGRNNDQEIDGQNNNDNSVGGPSLFLSNTEFVGQYVLVTNNFGPEYGRNAGSVVNVITKSGTNNWHGVLFGQDRTSYLAALSNTQKNTDQPGTKTPFTGPPRFNEEFSGGSIGGPIVKNKAFLFGGFDSDLFSGQNVFTTTSLTPTPNGLNTLSACAGINATALSVLKNFGPYAFSFGNPAPRNATLTTLAGCNGVEVGGVTRVLNTPDHGFDFILKHDLTLGNNTFFARYLFNRNNSFTNSDNGAAGWVFNVPDLNQSLLTSWTRNIGAHMVNEARIGFTRLNVQFGGGLNQLEPQPGQLQNAFTNISFQAGNGLGIGPATNLPQARLVNTWQAQDNWNYVLGKHQLKAGVNWTYQRSPNTFLPDINGQFRFNNLSSFLTNDTPNRVQIAQGQPVLDFREYDTFLYAGDDWKISQNLTLNLGVTWTYYGQPENLFNSISAKREANPATAFWLNTLPPSVTTDPKIPAVTNSFGPSIGFAYSPQWGGFLTGHGKTTIRGGYRLLYDPAFYNIFLNVSTSSPLTFLQTLTGAGATANPLLANPTGPNVRAQLSPFLQHNTFDPRTQNETLVSPNFGPDKVNSWSLGFERELSKNSAFEARYTGNHGYNLFQTVDGNPYVGTTAAPGQLQAGLLPTGTTSCAATTQQGPGAGTDVGRLSCGLGVVRSRNNTGFSDYQALQTEFRSSNLFKQLTLRAGYTYAKTLDNVSEIFSTGTAGNSLFAAQNPFQTGGAERSFSGLDIPNVFTLVAIEQIPFFKSQKGALGHVLGGWTVSADYVWGSGQPYTPVQAFEEAISGSPFGNVYDRNWVNAFIGTDTARPFVGNLSAPANAIGIFAHDACNSAALGCTASTVAALNALPANQLVSLNALNNTDPVTGNLAQSVVTVTNSQVRYIVNSREAQTVFGTPFGTAARNQSRDAVSNLVNASIYKTFNLGERVKFTMNLTANNALNHFNFATVNPTIEFAGLNTQQFFGSSFGAPNATAAAGRVIFLGGKITF